MNPQLGDCLGSLAGKLMGDFKAHAKWVTSDYGENGTLTIQTFQPRQSKPVIDEIDQVLSRYYEFSPEELDFIVNFDIKYRMGLEVEADDE
jgi:hypothetical protein